MADVNANIGVNIDTSEALAQLKALQRQISQFHTSIAKSSESAALAQRDLQKNFLNSVNAIGAFSAELRTVRTTAESFTDSLQKNKFSMREYFRFAGGATKTFGNLFRSEFDTIGKVAEDRVKRLQTQYIKLGRDTSGAMKAIAIMPNELDMSNFSTQSQIAAQKQAIFNQLVKQGSTNLLNFGKNTQWAGRQLMVGFTLPLMALGTAATRTFMEMEEQTIKFRKVYGDLFTPKEETQQALDNITALGLMFTKYGVAVSQTVGLAAEAAAAGFQGVDLQRQTTEATRLSVLGQIEANKALETTISLQNAFKMSSDQLAGSIEFLNAVENQTVVSLDDITTAIPKVAPVIQQLGGDVRDLAFFMAAMKEGGINASEGANALKSGLAALINPTEKASAILKGYGINIKQIVEGNQGDLKATVIDFANALDTLDPLTRARAIEQLFGKFQFARLSTLFDNVTNQAGQAGRVLELAGTSVEDLALLSETELGVSADSAMNKFRKSVEELKVALVPVGQTFLQAVTPILEFVGGIVEKFNNLSTGVKKAIVVLTVAIGAIGPVALMTFGLLANGLANIVKGAMVLRNGYLRLTGQTQILGEQTEYLTMEQIDAAAASHSLDQSHARLTQTFTAETGAVSQLIAAYQQATAAAAKFAAINPGMMRAPGGAPTKRAKGKPAVVGGTGNKDTELALLMPGETVIPADMSKKYGPLINGMIAGNIPGYQIGRGLPGATDFAHITDKAEVQIGSLLKMLENAPRTLSQSMMMTLKELATVFGEQLKVFIYSGLGFTQSKQLNIGMAGGKAVSAQDFLSDFEQQGLAKWNKSLSIAGVKTDAVAEELAMYDAKLQNAVRSMIDIDQSATITSDQFAAIEREVRNTLPEFSQLRQALDTAQQALTEVRFNINEQTAIGAGLTPFQVPSKKFPGEMSKKKKVQLPSGKNIRLGGEHLVGRGAGGMGSIDASLLTQTAAQVTNQAVLATAQAAGTNSPSRKTIPIGEDIARGLQVGMANQQDEVAASGQALGAAAVGGTQSGGGRQRRRAVRPQGAPQTMGLSDAASAAVSPGMKEAIDQEVTARKTSAQRLESMNKGLMAGTFALTTLAGAGSMAGGPLGNLSQQVMKYSGLLFALMSVTQLLTQAKITELVATRASTVATAMGGTGFKSLFGRGGGLAGFGKNLLTAGKFALRFAGPVGLAATAMLTTVSVIKMVNAARERERLAIEGLGNAATLSADKVKNLGEFFSVLPTQTKLERTGPSLILNNEKRSQVDQLRATESFQKDFGKDIKALQGTSDAQAKLIFNSLAIQLKGKGFAKENIDTIIKALQEESGKTNIKFDFANIDLATEKGRATLQKTAINLGNNFGKQFSEGYSSEIKTGFNRTTGEVITYTEETVSKGLKKSVDTTSKAIAGMFNGLSGQIENGSITAAQFNESFSAISKTVENMPEPQAMFLLDNILKNMPGDLAKTAVGIKNVSDQFLVAQAAMLGVSTITEAMVKQLKAASESSDGGAARAANRVRAKIKSDISAVQELFDLVKQESESLEEGSKGTGEKSAFQLAIEQLQKQRDELKNTTTAYKLLTAAGIDAETALKYASDPVISLGLATKNLSTDKIKELVGLVKQIDPLLETDAVRNFFTALNSETKLKKELSLIVPQIKEMGGTVSNIKDILQNPELVSYLTEPLLTAEERAERIKRYLDAIRAGKNIDIKLGITVDDSQEELNRRASELFGFLERAAQRDYRPKIINAEKEVKNAQDAVDKIQKKIDAIQANIDLEQRTLETTVGRKIENYQEQVNDLQRTIEMQFDRPVEAIQNEIGALERGIELDLDRPLAELQERSSDLSNDLTLMDKAAESINEKYDLQSEALKKVADVNQQILDQQKRQISLADALTQGDISAAAQMAQESRASSAEASYANTENTLQAARQLELDRLRNAAGLTRKQIEEAQFAISQQVFALEEQREAVQARIQIKQDKIFAIEQARQVNLKQIKAIEDAIYLLEEQREATLLVIRGYEDEIYNIKVKELDPTANALKLAQDNLQAVKDELQIRLDNIDLQKDAFEAAEDASIAAKVAAGEYNDVLLRTVDLLRQISALNSQISTGASAAKAVTQGGTVPPVVQTPTTPLTPAQENANKINNEISNLTDLRSAIAPGSALSFKLKEQIDELKDNLANPIAPKLIVDEQSKFRAKNNIPPQAIRAGGGGGGGRTSAQSLSSGGMVKPKYFSVGGAARGTDIVPAMLTPGEFVMSKYAVNSYGVDKMKAMNTGSYEGEKVYNYNLSVNVKSDANPDDIARVVITQIKQIDSQRVRGQRV